MMEDDEKEIDKTLFTAMRRVASQDDFLDQKIVEVMGDYVESQSFISDSIYVSPQDRELLLSLFPPRRLDISYRGLGPRHRALQSKVKVAPLQVLEPEPPPPPPLPSSFSSGLVTKYSPDTPKRLSSAGDNTHERKQYHEDCSSTGSNFKAASPPMTITIQRHSGEHDTLLQPESQPAPKETNFENDGSVKSKQIEDLTPSIQNQIDGHQNINIGDIMKEMTLPPLMTPISSPESRMSVEMVLEEMITHISPLSPISNPETKENQNISTARETYDRNPSISLNPVQDILGDISSSSSEENDTRESTTLPVIESIPSKSAGLGTTENVLSIEENNQRGLQAPNSEEISGSEQEIHSLEPEITGLEPEITKPNKSKEDPMATALCQGESKIFRPVLAKNLFESLKTEAKIADGLCSKMPIAKIIQENSDKEFRVTHSSKEFTDPHAKRPVTSSSYSSSSSDSFKFQRPQHKMKIAPPSASQIVSRPRNVVPITLQGQDKQQTRSSDIIPMKDNKTPYKSNQTRHDSPKTQPLFDLPYPKQLQQSIPINENGVSVFSGNSSKNVCVPNTPDSLSSGRQPSMPVPIAQPKSSASKSAKNTSDSLSSGHQPFLSAPTAQRKSSPLKSAKNTFDSLSSCRQPFKPASTIQQESSPSKSAKNTFDSLSSGHQPFLSAPTAQRKSSPLKSAKNTFDSLSSGHQPFIPVPTAQRKSSASKSAKNTSDSLSSCRQPFIPVSTAQRKLSPLKSAKNTFDSLSSGRQPFKPISTAQQESSPSRSAKNTSDFLSSCRQPFIPVSTAQRKSPPLKGAPNSSDSLSSCRQPFIPVSTTQRISSPLTKSPEDAYMPNEISSLRTDIQPMAALAAERSLLESNLSNDPNISNRFDSLSNELQPYAIPSHERSPVHNSLSANRLLKFSKDSPYRYKSSNELDDVRRVPEDEKGTDKKMLLRKLVVSPYKLTTSNSPKTERFFPKFKGKSLPIKINLKLMNENCRNHLHFKISKRKIPPSRNPPSPSSPSIFSDFSRYHRRKKKTGSNYKELIIKLDTKLLSSVPIRNALRHSFLDRGDAEPLTKRVCTSSLLREPRQSLLEMMEVESDVKKLLQENSKTCYSRAKYFKDQAKIMKKEAQMFLHLLAANWFVLCSYQMEKEGRSLNSVRKHLNEMVSFLTDIGSFEDVRMEALRSLLQSVVCQKCYELSSERRSQIQRELNSEYKSIWGISFFASESTFRKSLDQHQKKHENNDTSTKSMSVSYQFLQLNREYQALVELLAKSQEFLTRAKKLMREKCQFFNLIKSRLRNLNFCLEIPPIVDFVKTCTELLQPKELGFVIAAQGQ